MDNDRRILQICTAVVLGAVILRLLSGPVGQQLRVNDARDIASALLFLHTGRVVKLADAPEDNTVPVQTEAAAAMDVQPFLFTADDIGRVTCNSYSGDTVDIQASMKQPLTWNLKTPEESVLILHSHATESYRNTEGYTQSSEYRTLEENYNMISVGAYLSELLQEQGISVLHQRQLHDYPSYNGSYEASRQTMQTALQAHPAVQLVLDLHRDAMVDSLGNQIGYTVDTDNGKAAKVMLVVGAWNDNWQENMALAVKLQARLEQICPGICRPISLRNSRFNQDLSAGALLIEVGAAGNTRAEALRATEILAEAIISLSAGAVYEE